MGKNEITVIVPTYNRCPYSIQKFYDNPLIWCILSLIKGNASEIEKIVVIDDASTDKTEENIKKIKEKYKYINIEYIRNKNKKNPCMTRNIGLKYTKSKYVFFMDDDCIINSGALEKARVLYEYIEERSYIGALHFPVYLRKNIFDNKISEAKIGKLLPEDGKIFSNFRMYPLEERKKIRINELCEMEKPIEIDFFHEVFLMKTDLIKKVGGFCENVKLDYIFSEGLFLSLKLRKLEVRNFQITDPQCKVIHFRYGSRYDMGINDKYKNEYPILNVNISLEEMIQKSNLENLNTGGRSNIQNIIKESISGRYAVFLTLSKNGAKKWKKYCYEALINEKDPEEMLKFPKWSVNLKEKEKLFAEAITQGEKIYEQRLF